ncbi:hypothetical protein [Amycolatopsis sp. cmx-4-68]|uniref:hypothetical protein n=1 Tax=Amycolatopsis sp. cmx-4-68 TaxID=2790938 RepID=UPI003978C6F7
MKDDEITFGVPRWRQRKVLGWSLRLLGVAFYILSTLTIIVALNPANKSVGPIFDWRTPEKNLLVSIGLLLVAAAVFRLARILRRYGRRHTVHILQSMGAAKEKPYVLYLRPFKSDKMTASMLRPRILPGFYPLYAPDVLTLEDRLSKMWGGFGRVIAVGQPDERLPQPGALRLYLPTHDWQQVVTSLIDDARLVLLSVGTGKGTLWELREVMHRRKPHHLVLVVFSDSIGYDEFRVHADRILAELTGPPEGGSNPAAERAGFPDYPQLWNPRKADYVPVPNGFIFFDQNWSPKFVRLDPTATQARRKKRAWREMIEIQLIPAIRNLVAEHVAEEEQVNLLDMGQRISLAQVEQFIRDFLDGGNGRSVPLRAKLTPGLGIENISRITAVSGSTATGPPESGVSSASAEEAAALVASRIDGRANGQSWNTTAESRALVLVLDVPAGALLDATQRARKGGAGDSDTFRLIRTGWGTFRLLAEPAGIQLRVDNLTMGLKKE